MSLGCLGLHSQKLLLIRAAARHLQNPQTSFKGRYENLTSRRRGKGLVCIVLSSNPIENIRVRLVPDPSVTFAAVSAKRSLVLLFDFAAQSVSSTCKSSSRQQNLLCRSYLLCHKLVICGSLVVSSGLIEIYICAES